MFVQVICQVKTTRLSNFYCFLGVSIHDCRDSQPSSGCLRKVGVLDFVSSLLARRGICGNNQQLQTHHNKERHMKRIAILFGLFCTGALLTSTAFAQD